MVMEARGFLTVFGTPEFARELWPMSITTLEREAAELLALAHTWRRALGVEGGSTERQSWLLAQELRRAGLVTLKRSAALGTDYQVTHLPDGLPVVTLGPVKRTTQEEALASSARWARHW